jgi:hypothetical protein
MDKKGFEKWLKSIGYGAISSRIANCNTVEKYEGDLDKHFKEDNCNALLNKLEYTRENEEREDKPKHAIPIGGKKSNIYNATATYRNSINLYIKFKNNETIPEKSQEESSKISQNKIEEWEENVIKVKIGLRILIKVLDPLVADELKRTFQDNWWKEGVVKRLLPEQQRGLIDEKLDISNCFALLISYWDNIFSKKVLNNHANPKKVLSTIQGLKVDRNINAHDVKEDISYNDANLTLISISYLCDAFGKKDDSEKIQSIIDTLEK